ncbi:MAG: hypothetical protein NC203_05520 [Firmicutes bacterium]|nr:hypothetical protein [Bacillota bacterium]
MKLKKFLSTMVTAATVASCLALPASADSDSFSIKYGDVAGQCSLVAENAYYCIETTSASQSTLNCRFTYNLRSGVVTIKSFTMGRGKGSKQGMTSYSDGSTKAFQLTALVSGTSAQATGTLISVD